MRNVGNKTIHIRSLYSLNINTPVTRDAILKAINYNNVLTKKVYAQCVNLSLLK